jgi:hypothetical protein
LKFECARSDRAIAVAISVARSTVQLCLARFAAAGLNWPLPVMSDFTTGDFVAKLDPAARSRPIGPTSTSCSTAVGYIKA